LNFNYSSQQFFCNKITNGNTPTLDQQIADLGQEINDYQIQLDKAIADNNEANEKLFGDLLKLLMKEKSGLLTLLIKEQSSPKGT